MTTRYVHGVTGNDANNGLTSLLAKKTLTATALLAAAGDTVNCAEVMVETNVHFTGLANLIVQQEAGQTQAEIRSDVLLGGPWTLDGGAYYCEPTEPVYGWIGTLVNWDTSINADGLNYGMLNDQVANRAACQATNDSWYWDTSTTPKRFYVRIGANLNPAGFTVRASDSFNVPLLDFTDCPNLRLDGINLGPRPMSPAEDAGSGHHPYSVYFFGTTSGLWCNSRVRYGGLHLGDVNDIDYATGMRFVNITQEGCRAGTLFVFGSNTAGNHVQNVVLERGTDKIFGYLGRDAAELAGTGGSTGVYTHPGGAGAEVRGVTINDRQFVGYTGLARGTPVGYDVSSLVDAAQKWNDSTDCFRIRGGSSSGNLDQQVYRSTAFTRHRFLSLPGADGSFSDTRGITLTGAATGFHRLLLECCVVIFDFTKALTTTASHGVGVINAGVTGFEIILNNCTIINLSDQTPDAASFTWRPLITPGYNTATIRARRCIFAHKTAATMHALSNWDDGNTTWDVQDCLYLNIDASRFAENGSYNTQAGWLDPSTGVDRQGGGASRQILTGTPFKSWATGELDPAHPAFRLRTINTEYQPLRGVNGALFANQYGAWQVRRPRESIARASFGARRARL